MKDNQLTIALRALTKTEFRQFGNFIRSPYFNNRSEVIRFYEAIKTFYPGFDFNESSNETVFRKVYPGKKINDTLMRKLFSLTTNLLTEFLAINSFRENKLEVNIHMIDKLRQKKLPGLFNKKAKQLNELMDNSIRTVGFYETNYKFTSIVSGHLLNTNEKSMVNRLQNELDDFVEFFVTVIFLLYIRLGEWSRNFNIKFDLKLFDEVTKYYSKLKTDEVSLASLYYNMLMLLNTEDEKYYFELMKSRDKFEKKLSKMDDYNIAIVSMQYCYKRVMKGNTEYRRHQFDITKKILENDLIPEGFIEPYFFTNTIRNACNIGEFLWSEKFISEYKMNLNPDTSDEIINYSQAMIEFGKNNFENSLERLSKINIERSNMKIDIKNLQVMNYYELDYKLELESLIDSYKHFLQRDKSITKQSKISLMLFLNTVSGLIKIYHSGKKKTAFLLKREIESRPYFNLKDWALKKVAELSE